MFEAFSVRLTDDKSYPKYIQLRDQLAQLDPFDAAGAYLHLSRYPKHAALIGAALYFVKQFLDQV